MAQKCLSKQSVDKEEGDRGGQPGKIGGRRGMGGGRRKGGKQDSQSGRNWEKRRKISQYCTIFYNRNRTKKRNHNWNGWEAGVKGIEVGVSDPPVSPHDKDANFKYHMVFVTWSKLCFWTYYSQAAEKRGEIKVSTLIHRNAECMIENDFYTCTMMGWQSYGNLKNKSTTLSTQNEKKN